VSYTSLIGNAWSYRSWSGGGYATPDPGAAITLTPDPARGVMEIQIIWPGATVLRLVRVHPDGTQHAVRGASPITDISGGLATVDDGECPLDVAVFYIATNPGLTGGQETADTSATLDSGGRTWLTHPADPTEPFQVSLRRKPKLDRPIAQGIFRPINRRHPVVISAAERHAPEGTIEINALSAAGRTQLMDALRDGFPILIRSPADYHFDPQWISLATITEDPEDRLAYQDAWLISAPFVEVDIPAVLA
jgi:hypothetical protein